MSNFYTRYWNNHIIAFKLLIRYWYLFIPIVYILFIFVSLNETSLICNTNESKCEINEKIFSGLINVKRFVDIESMESFSLQKETQRFPTFKNDGNWYYIYSYDKNGKTELFMESFHSNEEKANNVINILNEKIKEKSLNINIKF